MLILPLVQIQLNSMASNGGIWGTSPSPGKLRGCPLPLEIEKKRIFQVKYLRYTLTYLT